MPKYIISILALPVIALFFSCSNEKKIGTASGTGDIFIYNYRGPSVAPEYRRDYTIRVQPGQVYFAIDSYDKILYKDSSSFKAAVYDAFVKSLTDLHITKGERTKAQGCTGGRSDNLTFYAGSNKEIDGFIYYCGGEKQGNLYGDVVAAASLFKALIPDLEKKIEATEKNK